MQIYSRILSPEFRCLSSNADSILLPPWRSTSHLTILNLRIRSRFVLPSHLQDDQPSHRQRHEMSAGRSSPDLRLLEKSGRGHNRLGRASCMGQGVVLSASASRMRRTDLFVWHRSSIPFPFSRARNWRSRAVDFQFFCKHSLIAGSCRLPTLNETIKAGGMRHLIESALIVTQR